MERSLRNEITSYIEEARKKGFVWGDNDCALFANNMLVRIFNFPDVGAKFRGKYNDYKSATKYLKSIGYKNIADIAAQHGEEIFRPELGAIVLDKKTGALGICLGQYSYFLTMGSCLVSYPTLMVERMWRHKV